MATQIGVITAVVGTVTATAEDGSIRTLQAGDRVYANEVISTGPAGAIEIEFADGSVMDLGRDSQAILDSAVFNPNATEFAESEGDDVPDDVAAIQQAILEGEDPTEAGEATAAGAGVEGSDGGHDAVFVNYLNPEVTPDAGFETIGVTNTVDEYIDEQLIDGVPTAGLVTVLLDEDDLSFRSDEEIAQAINDFINGIEAEFLADTGFNLYDYPNAGVGDEGQPGDDLSSPNPTFFSGTLNADYGFNGPGSISFNPVVSQPSGLTSGGELVQIWVSADGLTLIGYVAGAGEFSPETAFQQEGPEFSGAEIIFSAQIDPITLNFTAGIYGPLDHPDTVEEGAFEENLLINMAFTITDADGDAAQGIVQLNVDDDSPVIAEQDYPQEQGEYSDFPYQMGAVVDEDDTDEGIGNTDSPGDDSSTPYKTLPINFGADGPAAENPVEISAEGIVDQFGNPLTSNGVDVQFTWNAATSTLEGTADGQSVINIHVNVYDFGSGTYTEVYVDLLDNLDHPQGANGESLGFEDNLDIVLNYTATDADGDQAYGSFDVSIDDDMPVATGESISVTVDEDDIVTDSSTGNDPFDNGGDGSYTGEPVTVFGYTTDFFNIFNGGGPATTTGSVATLVDFGADENGTFSLSSDFAGLEAQGLTSKGDELSFEVQGDTLVASADGRAVFTLELDDNGDFTFSLYDQLDHASGNGENNLPLDLSSVIQATDSDNDTITLDSGFTIDVTDDVPEQDGIFPDVGIVEEEALPAGNQEGYDVWPDTAVATGSLADQVSVGADEGLTFGFADDLSGLPELTSDGEPVSYEVNGDTLTASTESGEVFTLTLESNGDYTFTLKGALDHSPVQGENLEVINFSSIVEATDFDGDTITLDNDFFIKIVDDMPVATGESVTVTVDEDDIVTDSSTGNDPFDNGDDGSYTGEPVTIFGYTTDFFNIFNGGGPATTSGSVASLVSFGADENGTFSLSSDFAGLEAQGLTSKGDELSFEVQGDILIASADGRAVFTLELDDNGDFTFSLYDQLDHATGNGENNLPLDLSSVIQATDSDEDTITLDSGFTIDVTDDVPEQTGLPDISVVEEEALPAGNQEEYDVWPDTAVATGSLADQVSVGADEGATFSLSGDYTSLIAQNLTSDGEPLTYSLNGNTLTATAGQTPVFTLSLESNGDYTFTLVGPLDHADSVIEENLLYIDLSGIVNAEDFDGDTITLNQDFYIKVIDDSPEVGTNDTVLLDDDALQGGNPGGPADDADASNVTGTLSHSFGADGGSISWQTSGAPSGFTYETSGDDLLIKQGGETVLTLSLNPETGEYSVTQNAPIDHQDDGNNDENNQVFNVGYLVTDNDDDTETGSLQINVDDDTPTVEPYEVNTMRIISDDDTVAGLNGNPGEGTNTNDGAGTDSKEYNQSKTLQFSTGADGGTVAWNIDNSSVDDATAGISFSVNGDGSLIITQMQNGVPVQVAEITLDANTGEYNYTQTSNLLHTAGDNENEAVFTLGFTVTDGDGDTADGHLTLLIDDDTPVITSQQINLLTESFEDFAPDLSGNNWTVVGEGSGTIIGNNGIEWTVNAAGIEIQSGNAGGASASDGDVHAELDAHDSNGDGGSTLTQLSTEVELPTSEATLSFDFQPRPSDVDGSDMSVSLGDQTVNINVDGAGVIDFGSLPAGMTASQTSSAGGWTTITLTFTGLDTSSAQTLSFEGQGSANTLGPYIDNISLDAVASLTVDETALADGSGEAGASTTASFDFSGFFTGAFGADGPADADNESYSLNLSGEDIASGLYAVDNTDTDAGDGDGFGQGAEILLNQVGDDIVGSVGSVDYFTISVDAETGEVTLTQHENIWHADTTNPDDSQGMVLDSELLTLVKTITDADEDSAEATLDLGGVSFNFEDDAPTIEAQQPAQPYLLTVTNEGGDAGYNNTYGFYIKGENGEPVSGEIIWANVKDNESDEITVEVTDPSDIGFFIIPDGADLNDLNNGDAVTFEQDGEGNWQVLLDGEPMTGQGTNVLFDNADLNPGNAEAVEDNAATGNQNWEDIIDGDNDFNDVNINVSINQLGAITVDETDIGNGDPSNAAATLDLSGSFTADFGADGEGDVDYGLSVDTNVNTGLIDTQSGEEVLLRVVDGEVEGYINDGSDQVVFTVTVNSDGEVTLTQLRAVEHDDATDPDEANSPATLNAGAIALTGTVTDADGDSADASVDVGVLFAFEDDGPVAADDSDIVVDGIAEGNVVTAESTDGESGVDSYGADGPGNVTSVTFGESTEEVPAGGSVEIEGDYGTLIMHSDGSYTYTANPDSLPQNTQTVEGWTNTGSNMVAFNLGESFLTADGKFNDNGSGTVSTGGNASGFGVDGTSAPNTSVPEQINYSGSESEALAFKFDGNVMSATVQVSNMFQNENGGEAMRWHAFDADGNRIGSGIVSDNENASDPYASSTTADFGGSDNVGSFTISDIGAFSTLVFEGVPYSDDGSAASDDSDFFVNVTSYEVFNSQDNAYQDEFGYTIIDGDGDSASATLTLNGNSEPQEGQLEPVAPVAADNTYQVDGVTSGNIITDDDDNGGAASGRDYDNDTPVINLSINSVIFNQTETFITEDGTEIELDNGTLLINLDGSYTYTPNEDAQAVDQFDYTLVDPDGEVSDPATVTLEFSDNPVEITDLTPQAQGGDAIVDEDDLAANRGTGESAGSDGSDSTTAAGTFSINALDGLGNLTVGGQAIITNGSFASVSFTTPEGNTLSFTDFNETTGEVSYEYTVNDNTTDHGFANNGQNNVYENFDVVLTDSDGDEATDILSVKIVDDVPVTQSGENTLEVPISEVTIGGFVSFFTNANDGDNVDTDDGASDGLGGDFDEVEWGDDGDYSNYTFDAALSDTVELDVDSEFLLGTFTHNNLSIPSGTAIDSVDLEVSFTVEIDGVPTLVEHTISFDHNETPNDGANPDDIISITNGTDVVEIEVGGRTYQFEILGFQNSEGEPVTQVFTEEGESTSFNLIGKLSSTDDLPSIDGQVEAVFGADGPAGDASISWETGQGADNAATSGDIQGAYGVLTVDAEGNYSYVVDRDVRDNLEIDESLQDAFTYYTTDADGDRVENTLTINVNGTPNPAVANNDMDSAVEQSVVMDGNSVASIVVDDWSDSQSTVVDDDLQTTEYHWLWGYPTGTSNDVKIDPERNDPDSATTSPHHVDANEDNPATISADVVIENWRGGDEIRVELLKDGQVVDFDDSFSGSGGNAEFEVTESGNYSLKITGGDETFTYDNGFFGIGAGWRQNGDLKAHLKDLKIDAFNYGPKTISTTVNNAAMVAGLAASGNVLANDVPGTNGIELKSVDGTEVASSGDTTINGLYGDLVITKDGDYTYTPYDGNQDLPEDAAEAFEYTIIDLSDNSEQTATLSIDVNNVDYTLDDGDNVVMSENGGQTLDAQDGGDVLIGSEGNDILIGGDGNDHLKGMEGDDTLIGGAGNDILTGGAGADIFQWNDGDDGTVDNPAVDFVTDFNAGEDDVLNLADLLDSDGSKTIDDTNLDNYLKATFDADSNQTKIDVYTNGDANSGGESTQSIIVNGNQQDLTTLLNNNNLEVDQS